MGGGAGLLAAEEVMACLDWLSGRHQERREGGYGRLPDNFSKIFLGVTA